MAIDTNYVTQDTFEKMQEELHHLKAVDRPAASKAIAEAREKGDLKENAEYDAAKEAQGMLEAKIKYLEGVIATARILDESNIDDLIDLLKVSLDNETDLKTVFGKCVEDSEENHEKLLKYIEKMMLSLIRISRIETTND